MPFEERSFRYESVGRTKFSIWTDLRRVHQTIASAMERTDGEVGGLDFPDLQRNSAFKADVADWELYSRQSENNWNAKSILQHNVKRSDGDWRGRRGEPPPVRKASEKRTHLYRIKPYIDFHLLSISIIRLHRDANHWKAIGKMWITTPEQWINSTHWLLF